MVVLQTHLHHSVLEVKLLVHLVEAVHHCDVVVLVEHHLHITIVEGPVDDLAEENSPIATSSCNDGAIAVPVELHDAAALMLGEGVAPATLVAEPNHLEGANSEDFTIGTPLDAVDDMVIGRRGVELAAERVPDSVLVVLAGTHDQVVGRAPIRMQHDTVVSLPVCCLLARGGRLDVVSLALAVQNLVIGAPADAIDG